MLRNQKFYPKPHAEFCDVHLARYHLEIVKEMKYLGQILSLENPTALEVNNRIAQGWKKFWSLKYILKGEYQTKNKIEVINNCIIPVITYGSQTWTMTQSIRNKKLNVTQNSMIRSILKVTRKDGEKMVYLKSKVKR